MNPIMIFRTIRDLNALIQHANDLAGPDKRWTLAFTNRSFIAGVIAFAASLLLAFGVPFPLPVDVATDTAYALIAAAGVIWALIERITGKTRAIWNHRQGAEALQEADALSKALDRAGAQ